VGRQADDCAVGLSAWPARTGTRSMKQIGHCPGLGSLT
jgi:hypothetical protein